MSAAVSEPGPFDLTDALPGEEGWEIIDEDGNQRIVKIDRALVGYLIRGIEKAGEKEREQIKKWLLSSWAWLPALGEPTKLSREFREHFANRIVLGEHWKA